MGKNLQKKNGITLIALIVTIIILIILAAISINAIWNDNGILKKAQESAKLQEIAQVKEKLELAILAVQADITEDNTQEELPGLVDITTETVQEKLEEGMIVDIGATEDSLEGEPQKIAMVTTNGKTYQFVIKENMQVEALDENEVTLSYTFTSYLKPDGKSIDVDLKFTCMSGISKITFPGGTEENQGNNNIVTKTGVTLQLNTDYTYIITTKNGTVKTKTINIKLESLPLPEVSISNIIIAKSKTATASVEDNSQVSGTVLYIKFTATMDNGIVMEITPSIPYSITKNGTYDFTITFTYGGIQHAKKIPIKVNKYSAGSFVQYDAGIWTQEEIDILNNQGLYSEILQENTNYNYKFGGFKAGDSRNTSIPTVVQSGTYETPQYSGWRILQTSEENDTTYVTKLIHAGAPENYIHYYTGTNNGYLSEYILSSGQRQPNYPYTYNGSNQFRNWDMYKDKKQLGIIKEVHCLTYDEGISTTGNNSQTSNDLRKINTAYWLASSYNFSNIQNCKENGVMNKIGNYDHGWGIRPVIELVSGVQIKGGEGTQEDPYILGK